METALILSCYYNHTKIIKELLKHPNINVNLINKNNYNALMWACKNKNITIVKELLNHPKIKLENSKGILSIELTKSHKIKELIFNFMKSNDKVKVNNNYNYIEI